MKNAYYALSIAPNRVESGRTSRSLTAAHYDERYHVLDRGGCYVNRSAWRVFLLPTGFKFHLRKVRSFKRRRP